MSDNHYRREIFYRFPDIYKYLFREEIMKKDQEIFQERLNHHHDELRWLYTELYHNDDMFAELCDQMYQYFTARRRALKNRDLEREKNPDWFRQKDMLGMMLYIDNFAGNIKGVSAKLPYLKECNVNCLHLLIKSLDRIYILFNSLDFFLTFIAKKFINKTHLYLLFLS